MEQTSFPEERPFIGREDLIQIFLEAVKDKYGRTQVDEEYRTPRVILYHGIAGIGKSSLRKKLIEELAGDWPAAIWAAVDFQEPNNRTAQNAFFNIRANLKSNRKIKFPAFDIAFAIYWKKANPTTPLNRKNFQFWDETGIVGEMLSTASDTPIFGFIPKVAKTAGKGSAFIQGQWTKHVEPALNKLVAMESHEVMDRLPYFLAMDIRNFMAGSRPPIVLFFDTYEALVGDKRDKYSTMTFDKWIRELMRQLPEAIFVLTGRNELDWENHDKECAKWLESHNVEIFDEPLAMEYLSDGGIDSGAIKEKIYRASRGVPFYLSLSLKTHDNIVRNCKEPSPDDFGGTHQEIFIRFLRNLNDMEQKALEILAAARKFDRGIFRMLVNKSEIGFPVYDFDRLVRHSFISRVPDEDSFLMHELMREHFHDFGDKDIINIAHKWLYDYYRTMIKGITVKNIPEKAAVAAPEMNYHKSNLWTKERWFKWLIKFGHLFRQAEQWPILEKLWSDAMGIFYRQSDLIKLQTSLNNQGHIFLKTGKLKEASSILERAVELGQILYKNDLTGIINALANLSNVYQNLGYYEQSESLIEKAIEICNNKYGMNHNITQRIRHDWACILMARGEYKKAKQILLQVLKYNKNAYGKFHQKTSTIISNLAGLFIATGHYIRANCLYKIVFTIDMGIPNISKADLGLDYGNLAASYVYINDLVNAEINYEKALRIERRIYMSNHPHLANSINGYGEVCRQLGKLYLAQQLLDEALEIRLNVYGNLHPMVASSLNNLGLLYIEKAKTEENMRYLGKAEDYLRRSIKISDNYSINDLYDAGTNIFNLASCHFLKGDFSGAEPLILKAYDILLKKYGPNHKKSVDVVKSIIVLYESWKRTDKEEEYRKLLKT